MHTALLFNMLRNFFGYYIVMTEQVAENSSDFVAIGGNGFTHKRETILQYDSIWGPSYAMFGSTWLC
ncbi:MAG: hypothetical protein ACFB0A_11930 [Croceivirga sp.]